MIRGRYNTTTDACPSTAEDEELVHFATMETTTYGHPSSPPPPAPTGKIFITIWQGVGLVLAVSILSRGFQPAVDYIFSFFGIWISLLMGLVLSAGVLLIFAGASYFPVRSDGVSFRHHLTKLVAQDQINLAEIQPAGANVSSNREEWSPPPQSSTGGQLAPLSCKVASVKYCRTDLI